MTKPRLARTIGQLHEALVDLAAEYRKVGERHAVEHDVYHLTRTLAQTCERQAARLRPFGERYGAELPAQDGPGVWHGLLAGVREAGSTLAGRLPVGGVLLLHDLRQLHLAVEEAAMLWLIVGQAAYALRDRELLAEVEDARREATAQVMWVTTRIKETAPQALVAG